MRTDEEPPTEASGLPRCRAICSSLVASVLMVMALVNSCPGAAELLRRAVDRVWEDRMIGGTFGRWEEGRDAPLEPFTADRILSSPALASQTRYGITVFGQSHPFTGSWHLMGGLVGQIEARHMIIQLFGKEVVRVDGLTGTAKYGRDYSEQFYLLVRMSAGESGRIVKVWEFPPHSLALRIDPKLEESFRKTFSAEEAATLISQNKSHRVYSRLSLDSTRCVAIVGIDGLTEPFEERVDLCAWLRNSAK